MRNIQFRRTLDELRCNSACAAPPGQTGVDRMVGRTLMLADAQVDVPLLEADREIAVEHRQTRPMRWKQLIDRPIDERPEPDVATSSRTRR
jgi:hypothetical protein